LRSILIPLASQINDRGAKATLEKYKNFLKDIYQDLTPIITSSEDFSRFENKIKNADILIAFSLTGGTRRFIVRLAEFKKPILILGYTKQNAFASAIGAYTILKRRNLPVLLNSTNEEDLVNKLKKHIRVLETYLKLKGQRILLIGIEKKLLENETINVNNLKSLLNVDPIFMTLEEFIDIFNKVHPNEHVVEFFKRYTRDQNLIDELTKASRVYTALKEAMNKYNASAVGIRCFEFIMKTCVTPCIALSTLLSEGKIAGCEADLQAIITMMMLNYTTGEVPFMGNIEELKEEEIALAHCTVSKGFADKILLKNHFETGKSVSIAGEIKAGTKLTFGRISPDFDSLIIGSGTVTEGSPWSDEFCRTQLRIQVDGNAKKLIDNPVGNHLVAIKGYHLDAIKELLDLLGISYAAL